MLGSWQPRVEEAHMTNALNNLANAVTSYASKLANLTLTNAKLAEQIKVAPSQNNILAYLLRKNICGVTETQSENQYINKRQQTDKTRGRENCTITEVKQYDALGNFWTHGYKIVVDHSRWMCRTVC